MKAVRRWHALASAVAMCAAGVSMAQHAYADAPRGSVVLELEACEQPLESEIRRIMGVELGGVLLSDDERAGVIRVVVACRGTEVDLWLEDTSDRRRLQRTLELSEAAPAGRARLLALAAAELVAASREEREAKSNPKASSLERASASVAARTEPSDSSKGRSRAYVMADAIGIVRVFPQTELTLFGFGARGVVNLSQPMTCWLELTAEWGNPSRATGQVAAQSIGGGLGLGWRIDLSRVLVMPWIGARGGAARLQGEPSSGSATSGRTQSGPWLGPEMGLSATLFPRAWVHPTLAFSAGFAVVGVQGEVSRDRDVNLSGLWAAFVLGLGFSIP